MANNGHTMTVIACGSQFSDSYIYDWGDWDCDGGPSVEQWVDRGIDLFHDACEKLGRDDITWEPSLGEVIGYADVDPDTGQRISSGDGGEPHIDVQGLAEDCMSVVSDASCDDVRDPATVTIDRLGDLQVYIDTSYDD